MSESREHPASQTNFEAAVQLGYVLVRSYRERVSHGLNLAWP